MPSAMLSVVPVASTLNTEQNVSGFASSTTLLAWTLTDLAYDAATKNETCVSDRTD